MNRKAALMTTIDLNHFLIKFSNTMYNSKNFLSGIKGLICCCDLKNESIAVLAWCIQLMFWLVGILQSIVLQLGCYLGKCIACATTKA